VFYIFSTCYFFDVISGVCVHILRKKPFHFSRTHVVELNGDSRLYSMHNCTSHDCEY